MDEALKLLGSFARHVQRKRPDLAAQLVPLVLEWGNENEIPQDKLVAAVMEQS